MILAAADAAQDQGPPPEELRMAWRCEKWGMPRGQGWLNEPAGMVDKMTVALNVYNAFRAWRNRPREGELGKSWLKDHPEIRKIVFDVRDLRKKHGARET